MNFFAIVNFTIKTKLACSFFLCSNVLHDSKSNVIYVREKKIQHREITIVFNSSKINVQIMFLRNNITINLDITGYQSAYPSNYTTATPLLTVYHFVCDAWECHTNRHHALSAGKNQRSIFCLLLVARPCLERVMTYVCPSSVAVVCRTCIRYFLLPDTESAYSIQNMSFGYLVIYKKAIHIICIMVIHTHTHTRARAHLIWFIYIV